MPSYRNPKAALSPAELNALQRVKSGNWLLLSNEQQTLLISMALVTASENGEMVLTDQGKARLSSKSSPAA